MGAHFSARSGDRPHTVVAANSAGANDRARRTLSEHHACSGPRCPQHVPTRQGLVRAAARARREDRMVCLQCRPERHGGDLSPKSIDLTYVGPNPAINAYVKSRGAGGPHRCRSGQWRLGARRAAGLRPRRQPSDFRGKKIATPQFGNTQDVAARAWLVAGGLKHHADRRRRAGCADGQSGSACCCSSKSSSMRCGPSNPGSRGSKTEAGGKGPGRGPRRDDDRSRRACRHSWRTNAISCANSSPPTGS